MKRKLLRIGNTTASTSVVSKILFLFLLAFSTQVYGGYSQKNITINFKDASISKVLSSIEKQSSYRFLYNESLKGLSQKVNLDLQDADIKYALDALFAGSNLSYRFMENNLIIIKEENNSNNLPDITITGKVTGASGEGVPGVSITIKGTTLGTSTNTEGNYSIVAADNATLLVSAVGFTNQEIDVAGRKVINIQLAGSAAQLEQVVVVGYGTQKKKDLTGSISSVSGEEVARMPSTNPIASLQGKVPGLTISNVGRAGSSPVVRIRGVNSTNSAGPLYVVDGILLNDIDFLNPADIESIDVLRDPSSIAIYGLLGANGVIAVTTKKSARGQTRINLQSSVGVQVVQDKIDIVDAAGFKNLYSRQLANINAAPFDFTNYTANTNWQDLVLQNAIITSHNLSISGSGDKSTTRVNIGYTNQEGVLKYDKFERYLARLSQEVKFNQNIKVGGDVTGYHYKSNAPSASITNALWAAPIVPTQAGPGLYYSMPSFQRAQVGNPLANLDRGNQTAVNEGYRVIGNVFAEIKFLKSFTWRSTVYGDLSFTNVRDFSPLPFRFINLGEGTAVTDTTFDQTVRTSISQSQSQTRRFQQDHTLTFSDAFKGGHSLNVVAGFSTIYNQGVSINGNRRDTTVNIPNDPDFWYINAINLNNPGNFGGGGSENSFAGGFARASYTYRNKYLLNATVRRDASSRLSPENRWITVGSLGLGWVASEESFMANVKGIDFLKLRGAWGVTANANGFADNLWRPGISNSSTAIFGENIFTAIQAAYIVSPNLTWEKVGGIDIGFDLRTFQKRMNVEFTYYNRTTKDILTRVDLPNTDQFFFTNLGEITNKGIEVMVGWNDRIGNDLQYGLSANFSYNNNMVNSIGDNFDFEVLGNSGRNKTRTGESIGYFFGYTQVGIYQSTADLAKQASLPNSLPGDIAYADLNGDGVINPADRGFIGTPFPPYNYGGNFNLGYKGFDFEIELQGQAGHKIFTQRRTSNFAVLNYESNRLNAWTGPGTSNVEPILDNTRGNNFLMSTYYLEPADYLRLRTLQFGYNFSGGFFDRIGVQKGRVYLSGQNIKTWSRVTGYSPEPLIGSILGGGADNGAYPVPAVYSLGLNLTF